MYEELEILPQDETGSIPTPPAASSVADPPPTAVADGAAASKTAAAPVWHFLGPGSLKVTVQEAVLHLRRTPPLPFVRHADLLPEHATVLETFRSDQRVIDCNRLRGELVSAEDAVAKLMVQIADIEAADAADPLRGYRQDLSNEPIPALLKLQLEDAVKVRDDIRATAARLQSALRLEWQRVQEQTGCQIFQSGQAAVRAAWDEVATILAPVLDRLAVAYSRIDRHKSPLPGIEHVLSPLPPKAEQQLAEPPRELLVAPMTAAPSANPKPPAKEPKSRQRIGPPREEVSRMGPMYV